GGMLKYVRAHPVGHVTIAGGIGKLTKLMQGAMDLHSARSTVDLPRLAESYRLAGGDSEVARAMAEAHSAGAALALAGDTLAGVVARGAQEVAQRMVAPATRVDVLVVDRDGRII